MAFPMAWQTVARKPGQVIDGRIVAPAPAVDSVERLERQALAADVAGVLPTVPSGPYRAPAGAVPRINATRLYQQEGRGHGLGYLNNPFDEDGRQAIARQFVHAPAGGHIRSVLQGQEVFGHTITNSQARMAEQAAAGVLATGIGGWGLLSAIDALQANNTPQTPGTMGMG